MTIVQNWRSALITLGYDVERRRQRGHRVRYQGRPVAVVHPVAEWSEIARFDSFARPLEGKLLNDCAADGAAFGILAVGARIRLFECDPPNGAASMRYLDIDVQFSDSKLIAFLEPRCLAEGGIEDLRNGARVTRNRHGLVSDSFGDLNQKLGSSATRDLLFSRFDAHLAAVQELAVADPAGAAKKLFAFDVTGGLGSSVPPRVLETVDELTDRTVRFLAGTPLGQVRELVEASPQAFGAAVVDRDVELLQRRLLHLVGPD